MNLKICNLVSKKSHFSCEICGKSKLSKMYEFQRHSYVRGYIPLFYKKVCENCVYKEAYGTKEWKKKKKEGSLDG